MSRPKVPDSLREFLDAGEDFVVCSHMEPDGDCVASSLALGSFLKRRGCTVTHLNPGPFNRTEIIRFAPEFLPRLPEDRATTGLRAIVVDCSTVERIGDIADDVASLPTAVIDHHSAGEVFGEQRYVDVTAPATCFLIQNIIESYGESPTREEAELLLFGLATDTGFFRHLDKDSADVFGSVSRLVAAGAVPRTIHALMYGDRPMNARRLLARLIDRVESHCDGAVMITWESLADAEEFGRATRDSDTLYQLLTSVEGVRAVAVVREETRSSCTGSLRSVDDTDVGEVARQFGGGGHKRAAGFLTHGSLAETKKAVARALSDTVCSTKSK